MSTNFVKREEISSLYHKSRLADDSVDDVLDDADEPTEINSIIIDKISKKISKIRSSFKNYYI